MKTCRILAAAVTTALLVLTASACSDDGSGNPVSDATGKAGDMAASATAKAGDVASRATEKAAEAQASASEKLAGIKDSVDGKSDVRLGDVTADGDRSTAEVTARNSTGERADYTVTVNFRDEDGNVLDTVVVNVEAVEPGKSATATARSNRELGGDVKAEIGKALRH